MINHPNRGKTHSEEVGSYFVIKAKTSGKFLTTKADLFGDIEDARTFPSRKSAQEMLDSCVRPLCRPDFKIVPID
jgi:hypothetical protein